MSRPKLALFDGVGGWVDFKITDNGLISNFSCNTDVDFEHVKELQVKYSKYLSPDGEIGFAQFPVSQIINGGRYRMSTGADGLPVLTKQ